MLKHLVIYFAFCVWFLKGMYIAKPGPRFPPTKGEVWPKPKYQKKDNLYYSIKPTRFDVQSLNYSCRILTSAIERYTFGIKHVYNLDRYGGSRAQRRRRTLNTTNYIGRLMHLDVHLSSPCEDRPYFGMDESYDLLVSARSKLTSNSIWGVLRGLETFFQLIYINDDRTDVRINQTHIIDAPQYPHRGLLLDTSRHYVSVANIKRTLDAMAMNKMNVFHWHIVDDESFPYDSEIFPQLARKGAYSYPAMIYTKPDIELIVQYATERGIRVLPEFDVPGHTASWGVAYPNILTECYENNMIVGLGPMNPIKNETYTLLDTLIKEIQDWFPDKYLHVGGDEVQLECWSSNPDLKEYMKIHNMTAADLHSVFMERVLPLLGNKSTPIVWQEVFDEGVPLSPDTLIQVWKWEWEDEMVKVLESGHRLIFSSSWYLDHLKSGGDWKDFYAADPRQMVESRVSNATLLENILGGEACMWGEVVDDNNVISRVWPRTSAVAERLWSPKITQHPHIATNNVVNRLEEHSCRMNRRGIRAQPPNGPGFCL